MTYRSDLDALEARHDALAADVAERTRELDATKKLLDDARAKHRLPVLDNIQVAAPCAADWSQMAGDARVRHCADCDKHVYNLSEMTREEAQALLIETEGKLCVRYFRRHDGTILTANCPVGTKRRRRRRWFSLGIVALLASAVGKCASGGCFVMGKMKSADPEPRDHAAQRDGHAGDAASSGASIE